MRREEKIGDLGRERRDTEERDGYMEHGRDDERDWEDEGRDAGVLGRGKRGHSCHFLRIEALLRARAAPTGVRCKPAVGSRPG
jgi:hypothetical protein